MIFCLIKVFFLYSKIFYHSPTIPENSLSSDVPVWNIKYKTTVLYLPRYLKIL